MEFESKVAHRKSRAPWQSGAAKSNPYARVALGPDAHANTLAVPGAAAAQGAGRRNRRMSIHAAAAHGRYDGGPPALLPLLHRTGTNQLAVLAQTQHDGSARALADLAGGTAAEIDDYYNVLSKQQALVSRDIKANVDENQRNILELTRDLKETQDELLQLRVSTRELYEVLDDFKEAAQRRVELEEAGAASAGGSEAGGEGFGKSGRAKPGPAKDRSLIIYLEKMWTDQLHLLFKHVDGAARLIEAVPGRHILTESGRWSEINVGNWKAVRPAHLFILSDMVLVATKRVGDKEAGAGAGKARLQAVFCWRLQDVNVAEVAAPQRGERDDKTYSLNLSSSLMSYVYQTDRYDHFVKVMEALRKGKSELAQQQRRAGSGDDGADERRALRRLLRHSGVLEELGDPGDPGDAARDAARNSAEVALQDISAKVHLRHRSHDLGEAPGRALFSELKRVEDRIDEVDVELAHNKHLEGVGLIRYIENKLASIEAALARQRTAPPVEAEVRLLIEVVAIKTRARKVAVEQGLVFGLRRAAELSGEEVAQTMELFASLGRVDRGVEAYLALMLRHLSETALRLIEGVQGSTKIDVVNYLANMVLVYVAVVQRVVLVYGRWIAPVAAGGAPGAPAGAAAGAAAVDSSWVVDWSTTEMTRLLRVIQKHLYGTLVTTAAHDLAGEPVYKVRDARLFDEFVAVVKPQLDELKGAGVNLDFVFQDVFLLRYA